MMDIAIFGKHQSFGDFVADRLPSELRDAIQTQITGLFGAAQQALAEEWTPVFDAARPIRFWLGAEFFGTCLCGVLVPSADRVERRYPLLALTPDVSECPPPLMPDQAVYQALEDHLYDLRSREIDHAADLGLGETLTCSTHDREPGLWAVNADADPADLLQAIGSADYTQAGGARTYWWCAPDDIRSGAIWSCAGFVGVDAILWLISGVPRAEHAEEDRSGSEQMQTIAGDTGLD